jgi:predicted nicotinamide N-methyase
VPELIAPPQKNLLGTYGIWLFKNNHIEVKKIRKNVAPSAHGDRLWDSSYLIMDYFTAKPLTKKLRVLDIGCGWGPTSIFFASKGCQVTGMDIDQDVFSFLDAQANLNDVKITKLKCAMKDMKKKDLEKFDLIVGADICFWDELATEWFAMLKRAKQAGVKQIVLADPGRSPFLALVDKCEKKWPTDLCSWYALEPKKFEGSLMIATLN